MKMMDDIFEIFENIVSEDDEDIINFVEGPRRLRHFRIRPNHMETWNNEEFSNRFRLSKESVRTLLEHIEHLLVHQTERNHAVQPLTQLLICLRFYACGSMLVVAGDFGGIHKATASRIVRNVSRAIASLAPIYIRMPETDFELTKSSQDFWNIARFPNVIGAIDCTHIRIQSPGGENAEHFRNRKGYFSLNVQTVSDAQGKICNIVARWPGACHDSTIFNNSRLKAQFEQGRYNNHILLGDSGYGIRPYLMTPLHNPVLPEENLYNESQIRTRNVVERSYGIWKRRFPILRLEIRLKLETVKAVIVATAVLHNIALQMNDEEPADEVVLGNDGDDEGEHLEVAANDNGIIVRQNLITHYFSALL